MSLHDKYNVDMKLAKDGVWHTLDVDDKGVETRFLLAFASKVNPTYKKQAGEIYKPHTKSMQLGTMPDKVAEQLMTDVFAKHVLIGWENVPDASGKMLKYTYENVIKVMGELPLLRDQLEELAADDEQYRKVILDGTVKN